MNCTEFCHFLLTKMSSCWVKSYILWWLWVSSLWCSFQSRFCQKICKVLQVKEYNQVSLQLVTAFQWCCIFWLLSIIHTIHRFKSFDWLKESHMTWIIFRQCSCLQTNPCVLVFTISLTLRRSCHSCRIWNSIAYFPDFTIRYGLKNLWMGCIKQILTALLFGEW